MQVHYINIEGIDKNGDSSGVYLYYTKKPQPKTAGMLSMHVNTNVPKLSRSYQDVACRIEEHKVNKTYQIYVNDLFLIVFY